MSDFPSRAPQIWSMEPCFQRSQFRAGINGAAFRFVSSGSPGAKRHDIAPRSASRYNAPGGQMVQGRHRTKWAILAGMLLCTAFAVSESHAQSKPEPDAQTTAE